jgi:GT2 family glycosyltransferase
LVEYEPKVSIVVTNFNNTKDLDISLNALLQTEYRNVDLVIVDCCTANFDEWIKEKYPKLKSIHFSEDIGTAAQRNAGFQSIDKNSDYVCFIDDDVVVVPNWLNSIVELMENDREIGAVQPLRFNYKNRTEIDGLGYYMTRTGFPHQIETTQENLSRLMSKKMMDIFYGETTVIVVRHKALLSLDSDLRPFDNDHLYAWDDVDLSWRIWLLGYRVVIISDSVCYHNRDLKTRVTKTYPSRYVYLNTRGRFIALIKNYELSYFFKFLPIAVSIEIMKSVALLYYKPNHSIATLRGIVWGFTHFSYVWRKRSRSRRNLTRKNKDLNGIFIKTSPKDLLRQFGYHWR